MRWKFEAEGEIPQIKEPVFIEGLPGIGNVGKIAADFIIEELNAKKVYEITSYSMPHSVFVNEENLVELPKIEMYYSKEKNMLLLTGDVQPIDEESSYEFSNMLLDYLKELSCTQVITLAGIGLQEVPAKPNVYCTGNSVEAVDGFKNGMQLNTQLYGVVGPIVGVSGLLLGLATKYQIPAVSLLAETIAHPMYLGIKGARGILKALDKKFDLKLDLKKLDNEISKLDKEMKKTEEINKLSQAGKQERPGSTSYIG